MQKQCLQPEEAEGLPRGHGVVGIEKGPRQQRLVELLGKRKMADWPLTPSQLLFPTPQPRPFKSFTLFQPYSGFVLFFQV